MDKRRVHELKTDPAVFEATRLGLKTCEIRVDDRDFMVGDVLVLRETTHSAAAMRREGWPLGYTGRTLTRTVSHVLVGYGLQDGYVALSFAPGDPAAYVVYAPNGNVRLWSTKQKEANRCAVDNGLTVTPLYAHPAVTDGVPASANHTNPPSHADGSPPQLDEFHDSYANGERGGRA